MACSYFAHKISIAQKYYIWQSMRLNDVQIAFSCWLNWNVEMHWSFNVLAMQQLFYETAGNRLPLLVLLFCSFEELLLFFFCGATAMANAAAFKKATLTISCKLTWQAKPFVHVISRRQAKAIGPSIEGLPHVCVVWFCMWQTKWKI